jgi:chromosome partitioning protein
MKTKLYDREAYRAIFSFGGTLSGLADKGATNLNAALRNARDFTAEVVELLRVSRAEKGMEVA